MAIAASITKVIFNIWSTSRNEKTQQSEDHWVVIGW